MFDSTATQRRSRQGFSLIEIVIVLLVVGIIAAVAVPKWSGAIDRYQADMAAAKLVADLKFAGTHARASSRNLTITFFDDDEVNGNRWQFDTVEDPQLPGQLLQTNIGLSPYQATLTDTPDSIVFDIFGAPDETYTFVLDGATERERQVVIQKGTGEITTQ